MNARRSWTLLALMGMLLMCDVDRRELASAEPTPQLQAPEKPVAATSLGEEALSSASLSETPPAANGRISADVPDKPLPKQKRPPCTARAALVINGGCWRPAPSGADLAPCDDDLYEYKGRCYNPILIKGAPFQVSLAIAASPGILPGGVMPAAAATARAWAMPCIPSLRR